jgi:outer membrane protein OmpA-like peptidoglycan-associated protein
MRAAVLAFAAGIAAVPAYQAAPELVRLLQPAPAYAGTETATCEPLRFSVYFQHDQAELTGAAKTTLDFAGHAVNGCAIEALTIQADADTVSTPEGRKLSGLRGAALLRELNARGVAPGAIVISAAETGEPASAEPGPARMQLSIVPAATHGQVAAGSPARQQRTPDRAPAGRDI